MVCRWKKVVDGEYSIKNLQVRTVYQFSLKPIVYQSLMLVHSPLSQRILLCLSLSWISFPHETPYSPKVSLAYLSPRNMFSSFSFITNWISIKKKKYLFLSKRLNPPPWKTHFSSFSPTSWFLSKTVLLISVGNPTSYMLIDLLICPSRTFSLSSFNE